MNTIQKQDKQRPSFARRMMNAVRHEQRRFADFLSWRYNRLSQRGKKVSLVLFGIVMGGASLYLMVNSTHHPRTLLEATSKFPIAVPPQTTESLITLEEYRQLTSFRRSLDSLRQFNPMFYDRVIRERKGLLDSLDFLISLYKKR